MGNCLDMVERTIDQRQPAWPQRVAARSLEIGQARLVLIAIAVWICALDLIVKMTDPTKAGYFHKRADTDLAVILVISIAIAYAAPLVRSPGIIIGSGLMVGGGLGNALSIVISPQGVPNPFVVPLGDGALALNLADLSVVLGLVLTTIAAWKLTSEVE
jgi:hypothetical protein